MVFSGLTFLYYFLPITLLAYFLTPERYRNITLTAASLIFYAWGEPVYVLLMLFSICFNFFCGILIEKTDGKKPLLILSVAVNIGVLCVFKYLNFITESLNIIPGVALPAVKIALPIGISFYTFQAMSYVIDVYRGDVPADKSIIDFTAYVSLFPQLIAGPIVRYSTVREQLTSRTVSVDKAAEGAYRFLCGLAKKVLLANDIGMLWDKISTAQTLGAPSAWLGIAAFTLQIYFDFSGYSDMAIGLGKILGFDFLENFNYPYIAVSATDFWRRWHISLSTWFRDYVYIPLGGNRVSRLKNCVNILIVWALTGLWHGASWNFILWGIYYGIILICEKLFLLKFLKKLPRFIQRIYALLTVMLGWALFAIDSFPALLAYLHSMFFGGFSGDRLFMYSISSYFPLLIAAVAGCTPLPKKLVCRYPKLKPILALISLLVCTAYLADSTYNPFLYFRF